MLMVNRIVSFNNSYNNRINKSRAVWFRGTAELAVFRYD